MRHRTSRRANSTESGVRSAAPAASVRNNPPDASAPECIASQNESRDRRGEKAGNLWRQVLFPQPGRPVPLPVALLGPLGGAGGLGGGVRVLPRHVGSGGGQADALAQSRAALLLQGLRARHGAGVGLHGDQVGHLRRKTAERKRSLVSVADGGEEGGQDEKSKEAAKT